MIKKGFKLGVCPAPMWRDTQMWFGGGEDDPKIPPGQEAFFEDNPWHWEELGRVTVRCMKEGDPAMTAYVAFRDYLTSHPEAFEKYKAIKIAKAPESHGDSKDSKSFLDYKMGK